MVQLQRFKKLAAFAGTFAIALLIGYVMQYGDADASRYSAMEATSSRNVLPAQIDTSPLLQTSQLEPKTLAPIQLSANLSETIRFDAGSVKLAALVGGKADALLPSMSAYTNRTDQDALSNCPVELETDIDPGAMVTLKVDSYCRPDTAFEVQHSGLVVSGLTDTDGRATLTLPALEQNGSFTVTLEDGSFGSTSVVVPEAENYSRVVLQWADDPGSYMRYSGDAGPSLGQLTRLGSDTGASNRFAEVYTIPASVRFAEGLENLTVQVEVTQATCSRPFLAERIHVRPGQELERKDIRITLPPCDYAGTYLELKKILGGQTLLP